MHYTRKEYTMAQYEIDLINEFLANGGQVTKCPPALAKGNEASIGTRLEVARQRKEFKKQ
jgi:hypothetical protein|tara:strand:+ start:8106 stop:8285 length:180 start_codon:yes stop_codon:yes gene_type:complete